jgi:SAM-dependent methyltransferase
MKAKEHFLRNFSPDSKFLEIGCGSGSVFEKMDSDANYMAIDMSDQAIINATSRLEKTNIKFATLDALNIELIDEKFDVILDSHLIHCLANIYTVESLLNSIHSCLKEDGIYVLETIIANGKFADLYKENHEYKDGYFLGQYPNVGNRIVFEQVFLEKLFVDFGFKIEFLRFPIGSKIIFDSRREEALESDPDVIQLILRKA